jgi:hypothetical protein
LLAFCAQLASYLTKGEIEAKPSISCLARDRRQDKEGVAKR